MTPTELPEGWFAAAVPLCPLVAFVLLGAVMLLHRTPSERWVARWVLGSLWLALGCAVVTAARYLSRSWTVLEVNPGPVLTHGLASLEPSLRIDGLSVTMMLLTSTLTLLLGRFSVTYLHREPGFARFFLLLALFASGMSWVVESGSLAILFVGWEWVGLASVLLIGFFQERASPVDAGLVALGTYRFCDLGLVVALVLLHHLTGTTQWSSLFGTRAALSLGTGSATVLSLCLLLAAMGKSAQLPFSPWLPRAMEGPTPSSALFYGALSVHAGPYLLLRAAPLLAQAPLARGALVLVGLLTALHATLVWRVQTDAKGALAYGVLTHLGLMFTEVGLGLSTLALVHLVAHVCLRCLQLLRAPSALRDAQARRAALRDTPAPAIARAHRLAPARLYRLALERFALEVLFERGCLRPLSRLGQWLDEWERRWTGTVEGGTPAPSPTLPRPTEPAPGNPSTGAA
ncbi:proton-conducting transporter transmembrane domain-containing protein [Myxococcus landrumensis]|uniref:Proton-conducting membrane transporter n=1 Tax=Myxococcus landrumensis TaxID=2813577 RepID=A0ABX7N0S5_9BACT|nr:proton-conducting transporter membrane subunit [Myxococcus landrumus]QSQ11305.1 proton-conducting membrane transporter [Myxococcus landrumus]